MCKKLLKYGIFFSVIAITVFGFYQNFYSNSWQFGKSVSAEDPSFFDPCITQYPNNVGAQVICRVELAKQEAAQNQTPADPKKQAATNFAAAVEATQQTQQLPSAIKNKTPDEVTINFGKIASMIVSLFTPLIAILVSIIGEMMGTNVIYGNFFVDSGTADFREILHTVWLIMRDLVNYLFIIVLLGMAFMSVFGAATPENNNFELKKVLPKFVLVVIGVNFTWFAAQVILDAANVVTNVVYAIPKTIISENFDASAECKKGSEKGSELEGCFPIAVYIKNDTKNTGNEISDPVPVALLESADAPPKSLLAQQAGVSIGNNLALQAGALLSDAGDTADPSPTADSETGTLMADVAVSPELAELIAKHKGETKYMQDFGKFVILWSDFNFDRFQSNAIASLFAYNILEIQNLPRTVRETLKGTPDIEDIIVNAGFALLFMIVTIVAFLVMGVVLFERVVVVWMNIILSPLGVLMFAVKDFGVEGPGLEEKGIGIGKFIKFAFLPALMGLPLVLGYILISAGKKLTGTVQSGTIVFETEIINRVHTIHQILWYALAVGVLWSSVSVAEGTAVYMKGVVEGVTGVAKSVGGFVAKLPLYAQFIPIGSANKGEEQKAFSLKGLLHGFSNLQAARETKAQGEAEKIFGHPNIEVEVSRKINSTPAPQLDPHVKKLSKLASDLGGNLDRVALEVSKDKELQEAFGLPHNVNKEDIKLVINKLNDKEHLVLPQNLKDLADTSGSPTPPPPNPNPNPIPPPPGPVPPPTP